MREISSSQITDAVKMMCIKTCIEADPKLYECLQQAAARESSPAGTAVLNQLIDNLNIAHKTQLPICQDTGFAVFFINIGQDVHLLGDTLADAVNKGVAQGYEQGWLRKSIIKNPITDPANTNDNTPAVIHTEIVAGDKITITFLPKGGGSENMSRLAMLKPADGIEGIRDFVINTIDEAGANPCPPVFVGVGIGGTFDHVAFLAKKALLRTIGSRHPDPQIALLESQWLKDINKLGIGPAGLGGNITALDLYIEVFPRHLASLPVAVNIQCHANRKMTIVI